MALTAPFYSVVYADNKEYYLINNDNVYFNINVLIDVDKGSEPIALFKIPNTYYADKRNVEEPDNDKYYVTYNGIDGWIKKSEYTNPVIKTSISNPYYIYSSSLTTTMATKLTKKPRSEGLSSEFIINVPADTEIIYIGSQATDTEIINTSPLWYYVKIGANYGFIHSSFCSNTAIAPTPHPNSIANNGNQDSNPVTPGTDEGAGNNNAKNNLLNALLAIGIAVPSLILVMLVFKPIKNKINKNKDAQYVQYVPPTPPPYQPPYNNYMPPPAPPPQYNPNHYNGYNNYYQYPPYNPEQNNPNAKKKRNKK